MLKKKTEECIALTDKIMTEHYRGNDDLLHTYIGENCLWIGSCDSEYYAGRTKILEVLDEWLGDLPLITLFSKSFECVTQDRNSCTIVGQYVGATDESSGEIFSDKQRVTFCWKEQKEGLRIEHMHISNPLKNLQEEEVFPHAVGKALHADANRKGDRKHGKHLCKGQGEYQSQDPHRRDHLSGGIQ